jgi:hypothetical protein
MEAPDAPDAPDAVVPPGCEERVVAFGFRIHIFNGSRS